MFGWGERGLYLSAMLVGRSPIGRSRPPHREAESTWRRRPRAGLSVTVDHKTDACAKTAGGDSLHTHLSSDKQFDLFVLRRTQEVDRQTADWMVLKPPKMTLGTCP